jgi:hypothetical protein
VQAILRALDAKATVGDWIVKRVTRDTALYMLRQGIRDRIHDHILKTIPADEDTIWITHSMGTIISYWMFLENSSWKVRKWYTLGSPLGVRSVSRHLPSREWPSILEEKQWINIYDERDVVSLHPVSAESGWSLPIDNEVVNNTDRRNPHSIEGYLELRTVGDKL